MPPTPENLYGVNNVIHVYTIYLQKYGLMLCGQVEKIPCTDFFLRYKQYDHVYTVPIFQY